MDGVAVEGGSVGRAQDPADTGNPAARGVTVNVQHTREDKPMHACVAKGRDTERVRESYYMISIFLCDV